MIISTHNKQKKSKELSSFFIFIIAFCFLPLTACDGFYGAKKDPFAGPEIDSKGNVINESGRIGGEDGLFNLLGGNKKQKSDGEGNGIGVNAYLWRASLSTLAFMPLLSADPFGGVIITDWYSPPEAPNERLKIQLYILGRELRSDGIQISIFRQIKEPKGWKTVETSAKTGRNIEDKILHSARQIRIAATAD